MVSEAIKCYLFPRIVTCSHQVIIGKSPFLKKIVSTDANAACVLNEFWTPRRLRNTTGRLSEKSVNFVNSLVITLIAFFKFSL